MTSEVHVVFTKWGGHRHWRFTLSDLGSDRFGWWLGGRAGLQLQRGDEEPLEQQHDVVMLVPDTGCWTAYWNWRDAGQIEVYVDVTTKPVRTADSVTAVDLDLDVIRFEDGRVELVDEDEFAEHQVKYGYPPEIIAQAKDTADELVQAMNARIEPFDKVGAGWLANYVHGRP